MKATRLRITSLKFISAVDAGAQGPIANVALVKRAPTGDEYSLTAKVAKLDDALGVVFGYAVASTVDGGQSPHVDLQGDAVVGGDELIKVALGFAEAGAASDVMHDCIKDGWVPFVMPLNAETKKAFKLTGDVEGIAIGMKPSAETYKRFQTGELAAFSIYGTGIREPLEEGKRAPDGKVVKSSLYTDEVSGHAHKICVYEDGSMYVEWATMEGAEQSHSHGIVFEGGTLTILADSGHTHQLAEGQPGVVVVPAETIVLVQASASPTTNAPARTVAHEKSTRSTANSEGESMKIVILSEAQHAHYSKLSASEQEAFVNKSSVDRDGDVQKALDADPVVFKGERTGIEVRKSQGDFAKKLAEQAENLAKQSAEQAEQLAKRDLEIEKAEVRKQAAEVLGGMPGADETHDFIIACLRKGGDKVKAEQAIETLKGMKATSTIGKTAPGASGQGEPTDVDADGAYENLQKGLAAFAKEKNITKNVWTDGLAQFVQTEQGAALKRAYDDARNG